MECTPPLPEGHPRVIHLNAEEVRRREASGRVSGGTMLWRGYIGTWEVRDGLFYLRSVRGCYQLLGEEPLFADWFTGVLRVPQGPVLNYVNAHFSTVFALDVEILVECGVVRAFRVRSNGRWEDCARDPILDMNPCRVEPFPGPDSLA